MPYTMTTVRRYAISLTRALKSLQVASVAVDNQPKWEDVEATGIFLRLVAGTAPETVVKLLLSAPLDWLAEALAEMRAREYDRGYRKGREDTFSGMDVECNLHADAPTYDELQRTRGLVPNSDYPSGWGPAPRNYDYPGGRWPGKAQPGTDGE
jgi:hypothetical protein